MSPIGVFDSGYGGLSVFRNLRERLPDYDFIYLGDNARAPYGKKSFEDVYEYTREAVKFLFSQNCPLVILACNTASAKALRTIQQKDLPDWEDPTKRVLGVIRPTAEIAGTLTRSGHLAIVGTAGTIASQSYEIEIAKAFPTLTVRSQACPEWVDLVENGTAETLSAEKIVEEDLRKLFENDQKIDALILACTHYPLLMTAIKKHVPAGVKIFSQGAHVAERLEDYLQRHREMDRRLSRSGNAIFYTTGDCKIFDRQALKFLGYKIHSRHCVF
ncbi:MAG: glutamate racemase [Opitutales bacterium]|nr:glutamate racemase [Opitutales bacterium]